MIAEGEGFLVEKQKYFNRDKNCWVAVDSEATGDILSLKEKYPLNDKLLEYALDRHERARVEYNLKHKSLLVVYNAPLAAKRNNHYLTQPITFIIKDDYLFTFASKELSHITDLIEKDLADMPNQTAYSLLFRSLFIISESFFPLIEDVDQERMDLNEKLRKHTTNQHLLALSDLSVGLVYLVTGARQNAALLETAKALDFYDMMKNNEKEQLNDALVEAKQAAEMVQLSSQILEQLSSTYSSLLNNNLNDTMKLLTVWSLILTIPTIVTGFYGMNMKLPFADSAFSWGVAILISMGLSVWLLLLLWRKIK